MGLKRSPEQLQAMERRDAEIQRMAVAGAFQADIARAVGLSQRGVGLVLTRLRNDGRLTAKQDAARKRLALDRSYHGNLTKAVPPAEPVQPAEPVKRRAAGAGRKPAGPDGVLVRNLPGLMLRLSPVALASLKALSAVQGIPVWRLVDGFVTRHIDALTGELAEDVQRLAKHELARIRADYPEAG